MTAITPPPTPALDDLFLLVYALLDDLYHDLVPDELRPGHDRCDRCDAEVLTLSGRGEAVATVGALEAGARRDGVVETVFSVLADEFRVETTRARSLWGVWTRVVAKVLAFNLSLHVNRLLGRPLLAVKSLYL